MQIGAELGILQDVLRGERHRSAFNECDDGRFVGKLVAANHTCVATQVALVLPCNSRYLYGIESAFRGEKRGSSGTENPCVAGSIPALPIEENP